MNGGGQWAGIPLWLLTSVSPRAVAVFGVIAAKWTDRDTGLANPGRRDIANALGITKRETITQAIDELVAVGAMQRQRRFTLGHRNGNKSQVSNIYKLVKAGDPPLGGQIPLGTKRCLDTKRSPGTKRSLGRHLLVPGGRHLLVPPKIRVRTQNQVQKDPCFVPTDQVVPTKEQQREKTRAATPEVSEDPETADALDAPADDVWDPIPTGSPGWFSKREPAAFEAELATLAMPGRFASPEYVRLHGYKVFDAQPDTGLFDAHVDCLVKRLQAEGTATSEDQCRMAMADVYHARAPRDRAWDRTADHERRKGRGRR